MVINVILNLVLIPIYGIVGSAVATLVSYSFVVLSLFYHPQFNVQFKMMMKSVSGLSLLNYLRRKDFPSIS